MIATQRSGQLALIYCGKRLPLEVLKSRAGFYIGTSTDDGPCSRESVEYWPTEGGASHALEIGEWTQVQEP